MVWAIFAVLAAFFQNLRTSLQKKLNKNLSIVASTYVRFAFALPFALIVFIFNFGNFDIISTVLNQSNFFYVIRSSSHLNKIVSVNYQINKIPFV